MCYNHHLKNFGVKVRCLHKQVTGSCHICKVNYPNGKIDTFLIDCGLVQEKAFYSSNCENFPFNAKKISFCAVTHAHIDHIGLLPKLTAAGFNGKIYCTNHTKNFLFPAINDSMNITNSRENSNIICYSQKDLMSVLRLSQDLKSHVKTKVTEHISITLFENAHLLGACSILVDICYNKEHIYLYFTGDHAKSSIFFNVQTIPVKVRNLPVNIITEATYGNVSSKSIVSCFEENIAATKGPVIIPVFSNGRAQEVLLKLKNMQEKKLLSTSVDITLDGKLARYYTEYYKSAACNFKEVAQKFIPKNFSYVEKEKRNSIIYSGTKKIMLTSSGTGSYGPAPLYIAAHLQNPSAMIHCVGHILENSILERLTKDEQKQNATIDLACKILATSEFSAHAKKEDLIENIQQFSNVKSILINHGNDENKEGLKNALNNFYNPSIIEIENPDTEFRIGTNGIIEKISVI